MSEVGVLSNQYVARNAAVCVTVGGAVISTLALGILRRRMAPLCQGLWLGSTVFVGGLLLWQSQRTNEEKLALSLSEVRLPSLSPLQRLRAIEQQMGDQVHVSHCFDHHALHDELLVAADRVGPEERETYIQLLDRFESKVLIYPNGLRVPLRTQMERLRINGYKPQIRYAELTSISDELVELEKECFSQSYSRNYMESQLREGTAGIAAFDGMGKLAGCILYRVTGDSVYIESVGRFAAFGRLGIGRGMMDRVLEGAREKGATKGLLHVRESNRAAIRLYESYGFAPDGSVENYYSMPCERAIEMAADIKTEELGHG